MSLTTDDGADDGWAGDAAGAQPWTTDNYLLGLPYAGGAAPAVPASGWAAAGVLPTTIDPRIMAPAGTLADEFWPEQRVAISPDAGASVSETPSWAPPSTIDPMTADLGAAAPSTAWLLPSTIDKALATPIGSLNRERVLDRTADLLRGLRDGGASPDQLYAAVGRAIDFATDLPDDDAEIRGVLERVRGRVPAEVPQPDSSALRPSGGAPIKTASAGGAEAPQYASALVSGLPRRGFGADGSAGDPGRSAPIRLFGGSLIRTAWPENEPDPEPPPEPEPDPESDPERVPQGWDVGATPGGRGGGGLCHLPNRQPKLPDGRPWPEATPDFVKGRLLDVGNKARTMRVFVPRDGFGPILAGEDAKMEYILPHGYDEVTLIGKPQVTYSGGVETEHALHGVEEALRMAKSNNYVRVFFNKAWSTISEGMIQSPIRPDVVAEARPGLNLLLKFHPRESLSPGQSGEKRQAMMPNDPSIAELVYEHYCRSKL